MKHVFTHDDKRFFKEIGISEEKVQQQLSLFQKGSKHVCLDRAATVDDGIKQCTAQEIDEYVHCFEKRKSSFSLIRFIPASGMATRMFKFLHYFISNYQPNEETLRSYLNRKRTYKLGVFLGGIEKFPFFNKLKNSLTSPNDEAYNADYRYDFIRKLIDQFSTKPKALFPFHNYGSFNRVAAEEQLYLSKEFAAVDETLRIHFTIPPETEKSFERTLQPIVQEFKEKHNISIQLSFSTQDKSTDTIAVHTDNTPFRDDKGNLLFRAGGHGSLIENLDKLSDRLIFLSNIDNISAEKYHKQTARYKKFLAGVLVTQLTRIYQYCHALAENEEVDLIELKSFMQKQLNVCVPEELNGDALIVFMQKKLHRPLRVCGMVRNEGEPGGGPFWVEKNGEISLQIVESAQVDKHDKSQQEIFKKGTHFNPVDIVCATHDYKGNKYDLLKFVDEESYFIANKSEGNSQIKALERPGLWNGAMADWNTIFVEVPLRTFNPVKNVNDLLRPMHQTI
jgi:hypothetical protein